MRLLNVDTFKLEEFFYDDPPPYAILSHTWGADHEEVSYRDVLDGKLDSATTRPPKVTGCCSRAKKDGYQYVWIDTCCIDKTNSVELQEAINSMFRWYQDAAICYAYLTDVPTKARKWDRHRDELSLSTALRSSRWFTRGWTLQELLAPLNLRFYDVAWECIGTKGDLCDLVEAITGIPTSFLLGITELHHASVAQRLSWAAQRVTKRQEDIAYCLLGVFSVSMPMIYGEGDKAFRRLQEQIIKDIGDDSILAWGLDPNPSASNNVASMAIPGTALAPGPSHFAESGRVVVLDHSVNSSLDIQGGSLRLSLALHNASDGQALGLLNCGLEGEDRVVGIPLVPATETQTDKYSRPVGLKARLVAKSSVEAADSMIQLQLDSGRKPLSTAEGICWFHTRKSVPNLELVAVHPGTWWHKERSLIEASFDSTATGEQPTMFVRFRDMEQKVSDFVAVLHLDSQRQPRCSLMVASRKTSLEEIADHPDAWRDMLRRKTRASNAVMTLSIMMETLSTSSSQRRFTFQPTVMSGAPTETVNATAALQLSGATKILYNLKIRAEAIQREGQQYRGHMTDTKRRLASKQAELDALRAKIRALQEEERRLVDELDRESQLGNGLVRGSGRYKEKQVDIWDTIAGMQRLIEVYNGAHAHEYDEALSKTAAKVLPFAIALGYDSLTRLLLGRAAHVMAPDLTGMTPLMHAVLRGEDELVRLLISKGADVSMPHRRGWTPLHVAVDRGLEGIARLLVEKGASLTARTDDNARPLDVARHTGNKQLVKLLTPLTPRADSVPLLVVNEDQPPSHPEPKPEGRTWHVFVGG